MNNKPHNEKNRLTIGEAYRLGRDHQRAGRAGEASAIFRKILAAEPRHADAIFALGIIGFREGRLDEAEALFRRAASIKPGDGKHSLNLGVVLQRKGDLEAAEESYRQSISAMPDNPVAHYSLGVALQQQGRLVEAEQAYRRALELNPDDLKAHTNLAWALCRLQRLDDAESELAPLLQNNPDDPSVLLCHGQLLRSRQDFVAAEAPLRRSLELREDVSTLLALTSVLRHNNRTGEAEPLARRTLELAGEQPSVLWELVYSHRFEVGDPLLETLEQMPEKAGLYEATEIGRLFMLAKAYDDLDRFEAASACARRANDMVFRQHPFAIEPQLKAIDLTMARFRVPAICPVPSTDNPAPVFIVGESRAGKTLVESLLASKRGVYAAGESRDLLDALGTHGQQRTGSPDAGLQEAHFTPEQSASFGSGFLELLRARAPGARWVTSTMPGYYMLVGFIFSTLPGARVIHCRRDPLDQCVEMYLRLYGSPKMSFTSNPATLAAYYAAYRRLMVHWRSVYGDRMLEIDYEHLVANPNVAARRLYDHCGIDAGAGKSTVAFNDRAVGRGKLYAPHLGDLFEALGVNGLNGCG